MKAMHKLLDAIPLAMNLLLLLVRDMWLILYATDGFGRVFCYTFEIYWSLSFRHGLERL